MRRTLRLLVVVSLATLCAAGQVNVNTINTIAGGGPQPNLATNAYLPQPTSAVRDSSGNTYIAVPALNTVFVVDTSGALSAYAGTGIAGFSGDGGAAAQAQLNFPTGLAIDKNDNLFISDQNNERIRRVDASSHIITTVAGSEDPYFGAYGGDGGAATNARLNTPTGVAVDGNGTLFIADTGNAVVRRVDATTQVIITYAGTNPGADVGFGCNSGNAASRALLLKPTGVAIDGSGNLFVSDTSLDIVCKVDASRNISTYAGTLNAPGVPGQNGDGGPATSAQIDRPTGLAVDFAGNLYITDSGNPAIRKVDTSANHVITTVAGIGTICSNEPGCGDGLPAARAFFDFPEGVFVDSNNNIVIADTFNMRVRVVSAANATIANLAGGGSGGDGRAATSAVLGFVQNLAVDANENVLASETAGERLRSIDTKGNISTVVGAGFGGATKNCAQPNCNGDGGPATSARFVKPEGVAVDAQGNYYIVDSKAAVVRVVNNQDADITVANIPIPAGQIATVAGNGVQCQPGPGFPSCGDDGPAINASLDIPVGIAVDAGGNIYISDKDLHTVRVVDTTGTINTFAGTPGQACSDYSSGNCNSGSPVLALLNAPQGLAIFSPDAQTTDLFVADSGDNVIRQISTTSNDGVISQSISTYAFNGLPTFGGDGLFFENPREASMYAPAEVAVDNLGNLYIGGGFDNVVRRVDAFTHAVSTVAGDVNNLNGGFSGDGGPANQAMIQNTGLTVFSSSQNVHDLFIADSGSNRIRKINLAPIGSFFQSSGSGSTIAFPITLDGNISSEYISVQNSGVDDLVISNLAVTGDQTNSFTATPSCSRNGNNVVPPPEGRFSGLCYISLEFAPPADASGTFTATLTFTTNDPVNPNLTYTLTGTATPTTNQLVVTLTPPANSFTPGGTVLEEPFFQIECQSNSQGSSCTSSYPTGTQLTLVASPDAGFNFVAWTGCPKANGPICQLTMDQDQSVSATFTGTPPPPPPPPDPQPTTITIVGLGSGNATVSDGAKLNCKIVNGTASNPDSCSIQYPAGQQTAVNLTAAVGDSTTTFVGWLGGECSPYNKNTCTIGASGQTVVLGAVFTGPAQQFAQGQVFLSTDFGMVFVIDPKTGNTVQVLSSGDASGQGQGLTFDAAGNLYLADSRFSHVEQFAVNGTGPVLFGTNYQIPWSLLVQPSGDVLVGQPGFTGDGGLVFPTFLQIPQGATPQTVPTATFYPAFTDSFSFNGVSWIELLDSADTVAYTTGRSTVQEYDLGEQVQHPDIITTLHGAFALRELPDESLLVADTDRVVRIDQNGNILQTYTIPSSEPIFQNLNLDPDGQSFWTNDEFTGRLYRINIQTGAVMNGSGYPTELGPAAISRVFTQGIGGIAVFGQALSGGADLGITLSAPDTASSGANVTYSVNVSNAGPLNATGATLTASIPNSTVVSLSPNTCTSMSTGQGTDISCPIGTLPANGQAASASFTMLPSNSGTIRATANVSGIESDPNLANNTATQVVNVSQPNQPPTCSLSINPTSGVASLAVSVIASCSDSDGSVNSASIDWGDGTAATQLNCDGNCLFNGSHTYTSPGTFNATLTSIDNTGASSQPVTQTITVTPVQPPACTLSVLPIGGPAPLTVTATGNCIAGTSPIASSTIDFGDGSGAQSGASGSHVYNSPGTFTVTVTATDGNALSGSATQSVTVGPAQAPACTLSVIPNSGAAPLSVTATGNCTPGSRPIAGTTLDFGDGSAAQSGASVTHKYTTAGTFTVKLTAIDTSGLSSTVTQIVTVTPAVAPACILTVAPNSGPAPLDVTATGSCTAGTSPIASTTLDFGDGSASQNGSSGTHRYNSAGTFTVKVTATDINGLSGSATQTVTVAVNQPPACTLSVAPTSGLAPLPVTATGSCSDPEKALSSTLLDFGDGTTQTSPSGPHTYTNAGTFTVTLTGTDAVGQKSTATQSVTVGSNTAPSCTLTVNPTSGIVPLPITATGNCVDAENNISTTVLDFGDATTVNAASGTHTYNAAGTFTVKVTATDALGLSGSASQTVTVTVNNFPQGVFVGISPGTIKRFAADGTLTQTLSTGLGGTVSGMGFDKAGTLYATDFTAGNISKFDPKTGTLLGTFGGGFNCQPETIVFDGAGNAYVGQQGCSHQILKFDSSGKLLTTFTVTNEGQGSDDIDLSADNCTLLYTSEGSSILRYDVCRDQQLAAFATGLKKALMLRILPDGGVIVADLSDIIRFNASGQQVMTYTAPGDQCLYSITLDQDGTSFWAGDYCSSNIYRFDLNSGKQLAKFNSGTPSGTVFGLAISGSGLNVAGLGNAGNIATSPQSASLATGQSATFTVSFAPNAAAAGHTLVLSCANLPPGLACSFTPPSITLGAVGTTTTATLTITRTTRASLLRPSSPWMLATWIGMVPAIVLVGFRSPRRRRSSMLWLGMIVACTGVWASCGGGGGGMSRSTTPTPAPQGTYTVIVVGNASGMQASTTVNLTVQ